MGGAHRGETCLRRWLTGSLEEQVEWQPTGRIAKARREVTGPRCHQLSNSPKTSRPLSQLNKVTWEAGPAHSLRAGSPLFLQADVCSEASGPPTLTPPPLVPRKDKGRRN